MWTRHIPACSLTTLFFHSESLLRHTLEEGGYNEKKKEGKKRLPWQWHNANCPQISRVGHPGNMENVHQSQQLPGLRSTAMKMRGISWQGPISDLLSWEQLRLSSFSLITRRFHFPEPDTLNSTQSLLRKVLKDTLQGEQHRAGFGLRVFQVKLAVKGF